MVPADFPAARKVMSYMMRLWLKIKTVATKPRFFLPCLLLGLLVFFATHDFAGVPLEDQLPVQTLHSHSTEEIFELFDSLGYTAEAWQQGVREIPRIYLSHIPARWQAESDQLTVARKKEVFFRLLAPVVLRSNELITAERSKLLKLLESPPSGGSKNETWLLELARKYKVIHRDSTTVTAEHKTELHKRVDLIPPSLALAQGAEESGWGTSRFALLGNSLFGQWDFSGKGIKPKQQRKELGDYGLAAFDTPLDAVSAYARNLNTHGSYKALRELRAKIRAEGRKATGHELATTLVHYSERGQEYIDGLHAIMRVNRLDPVDEAWLWNKSVIQILPAE